MQATDAQQALFHQWADGTDFVLDVHDSPKRQFNILAQAHGWIGGQEPWNTKWLECFDQEYIWRGDGTYAHVYAQNTTLTETGATLHDETDGVIELSHTIWTQYDGFVPDPTADLVDEFERLADFMKWDHDERKHLRPKFVEAEFASYYGSDSKSLENWRNLCRVVGIKPAPASIEGCATVCNAKSPEFLAALTLYDRPSRASW